MLHAFDELVVFRGANIDRLEATLKEVRRNAALRKRDDLYMLAVCCRK